MCALAGLPARAAARLRALEAGAPALSAAATCPLHLADLLQPDSRRLLTPLLEPDLFEPASVEGGLTLREARLILESSAVAVTLARLARRFAWRDLLVAKRELCASRAREEQGLRAPSSPECRVMATLSLMLSCPFAVGEGPDRNAAVREAAVRCARRATGSAACSPSVRGQPLARKTGRVPGPAQAPAPSVRAGTRRATCTAWPQAWPRRLQPWRRAAQTIRSTSS